MDIEISDEAVGPVLGIAAACLTYLATNEKAYNDWREWALANIGPPPGWQKRRPEPPTQEAMVLAAAMLIKLAAENMTPAQQLLLVMAKFQQEGGQN